MKKNAGKIGHRFPSILCFFIHPQPNNIGPAWQQPRALFYISLSLVGSGGGGGGGGEGGRGHSYCILALELLDYMDFAINAITEWKIGGGHTFQSHSLGTGDKCLHPHPHTKMQSLV